MNQTLEFLYSLRNQGSKFGIERMQEFCKRLQNPQFSFPSIHLAGTNGKGSVCTMLDSIYRSHGYKVGLFTSPHLIELGERIRVNGKLLSFRQIEEWTDQLMPIFKTMKEKDPEMRPTFFELMTAIAFLEFKKQKVDLAIIETGLGGRLDSTNVLDPLISVITTVGYDHCEMLGDKLEQIAFEKAGIIKTGKPVVVGWLKQAAREVVIEYASKLNSPIHLLDEETGLELPQTNLSGSFQRRNAALAQKTVQLLNPTFPVEQPIIEEALLTVKFPGRWQKISSTPTLIVDACHNGEGAVASRELWERLPSHAEVWFAACGEERAEDVLTPLLQYVQKITLFEIDQPRACTHPLLQKKIKNFSGIVKFAHEKDIPHLHQQLSPNSFVLITGSIYLIASVLSFHQHAQKSKKSQNWQDLW